MMPSEVYDEARDEAAYHVQVELLNIPTGVITPETIRISARVVHVFRGTKFMQPGTIVEFDLDVCRADDEMYPSGTIWQDYDRLLQAQYLEVFLNGQPPQCKVALWQAKIIAQPSDQPIFDTPVTKLQY